MKPTLGCSLAVTRDFPIDRERTIDFMGEDARVYATPMLVRDIEVTCREMLLPHLDPGEDSVGTKVDIEHLAPTLMGMTVKIEARLAELKGRAVIFEVSASDGVETVCRGRHARFVVDVAQSKKRLEQKKSKTA
jgi:fluoroacetyl-CoA thioesterase